MHTIQLDIPDELAERLAPYSDNLSVLLELGLQAWMAHERQEQLALRGHAVEPVQHAHEPRRARALGREDDEVVRWFRRHPLDDTQDRRPRSRFGGAAVDACTLRKSGMAFVCQM